MPSHPSRTTVSLDAYPDLVVILLGFQARSLRAIPALMRIGRGLATLRTDPPDGLLRHDGMLLGWNHIGFRQYWRDADRLAAFTRTAPHSDWWRDFLTDNHGSGFWHEAFHARGGVEAVYVAMPQLVGLASFATAREPNGPFLTAAERLRFDRSARAAPADDPP